MDPNESKTATAAGALATVSENVDPFPHYCVALACMSGAAYAHYTMKNPTAAMVAGGIGLAMAYAGYSLQTNRVKQGYDLGAAASLGLLAATAPTAYRTRDPYHMVMTGVGGISAIGNMTKSYQVRYGTPRPIYVRSSSGR
ncbi:hypothetical protein HK097_007725 [Rhizophlyctis rosea]|uniref:Transmembrane protein 14C n=1 Tax=Rhizophlyctis rosea TaxID=64517 RepID=A0AAD5SD79_9FUNG|nr:hypothetical protein HK097_007725 [Rhizophlyctis rosea]